MVSLSAFSVLEQCMTNTLSLYKVDEFITSLLSLPPDPEIISDSIYANSPTLDGRRFADEFIRRRREGYSTDNNTANGGTGGGMVAQGRANGGAGGGGGGAKEGKDGSARSGAEGWSEVAKKGGHGGGAKDEGNAPFKVVAGKKNKGKR